MKHVVKFFFLLLLSFSITNIFAQQIPANASSINIDQLTDQQLIQYMNQANLSGLSDTELETKAREKGLSTDQIQKLKLRNQNLNGATSSSNNSSDVYTGRNKVAIKVPPAIDSVQGLPIFGADLFDNTNLTFEPNLNIATPDHYIIGVNDELIIDIYGYSENTKKLKVTSEGFIRYPDLGPIKVNGITIEEARIKIKNALTKIYPGLLSGNTSVQISLGQIRSIHVTLLGEVQRPGTFTVSSLATIANALYLSGGPNKIGSFRNIELIRNGKPVVVFDLYDFLLKGDLTKNLSLKDDDIIKINPYNKRVGIRGAVKKAAVYELQGNEYLSDVLQYSGGYADNAHKELIRVSRFGANSRELITVKAADFKKFQLNSGDLLTVDSLANLFNNRVVVKGAIFYPGSYGIKEIPTLKDLIVLVKPKEEAYKERAVIRRLKEDYTPTIINFNVDDVLTGKFNLDLQREDSVHIYTINEVREKFTLSINGEINNAGVYNYADNMKVPDLILLAGGFKDGASLKTIEVSRRLRKSTNENDTTLYSIVKTINLKDNFNAGDSTLNFSLQPFDIVSVRRIPSYREQIKVSIQGEVLYPGEYFVTQKEERLSDLIKRAGGLKNSAYTKGAVLIRTAESITSKFLEDQKMNVALSTAKDSATRDSSLRALKIVPRLLGIKLDRVMVDERSVYNVVLEENDSISIPKVLQTIKVSGAVYLPKQIVNVDGLSFNDAINESGGFSTKALKRKSFVIYANGESKKAKHFLFFKSYPVLEPGAEVYVPAKPRESTTQDITSIGTAAAAITGLIISLIYLIKK